LAAWRVRHSSSVATVGPRLKPRHAAADSFGVTPRSRALVVPSLVALACAAGLGALGLLSPAFTDYEVEAEPALNALRAGDLSAFLSLAPAYGGSLVLRAPFALLPDVWNGGDVALFRSMAVPCLAAGAALGVALWARGRRLGRSSATCWVVLALAAGNPLTLRALEIGHPEELLGAVLCVAALLAAGTGRPLVAAVVLGLAIANKPWALLAVIPLVAVLHTHRMRALTIAGATTAVVTLPVLLAGGALDEATAVASTTGTIFQPWQVWWFLGDTGQVVTGTLGVKPDYRTSPAWLTGIGHPLVLLIPLAASLAILPRLRRQPWHSALLLLALAMLLRCLLDPWNVSYYALPFLLALLAWELHARDGAPVVSLAATLLSWITLVSLPRFAHPDVQAIAYLAWSLPLAALLASLLVRPELLSGRQTRGPTLVPHRQST
jgi:hypothetical protein